MSVALPATWRRKQLPACPACKAAPGPSFHRNCSKNPDEKGKALYIDMSTGIEHCTGCGEMGPLGDMNHFCGECGCVFKGGEIWQGMAAEIGRSDNLAWLKAVGIQRGNRQAVVAAWWRCRSCGAAFERPGLLPAASNGFCKPCAFERSLIGRLWWAAKLPVLFLVPLLLFCGLLAIIVHVWYLPPDENHRLWKGTALAVFAMLSVYALNAVTNRLWRVLYPEKRKG